MEEEWTLDLEKDKNFSKKRLPDFLMWLTGRKEKHIVVVSHSTFFYPFTGVVLNPADVMELKKEKLNKFYNAHKMITDIMDKTKTVDDIKDYIKKYEKPPS